MDNLTNAQLDILHQHLQSGHTLHIAHVAWAPIEAEWTPPNPEGTYRMREMESRIRKRESGQFEIHSSFTEDVERWRMPQSYIARSEHTWDELQALIRKRYISFDDFRIEEGAGA